MVFFDQSFSKVTNSTKIESEKPSLIRISPRRLDKLLLRLFFLIDLNFHCAVHQALIGAPFWPFPSPKHPTTFQSHFQAQNQPMPRVEMLHKTLKAGQFYSAQGTCIFRLR